MLSVVVLLNVASFPSLSKELDSALRREVSVFHDALRSSSLSSSPSIPFASSPPGQVFASSPVNSPVGAVAAYRQDATRSGQISLEFFQKKRTRLGFFKLLLEK